jgi:hypothetical protein
MLLMLTLLVYEALSYELIPSTTGRRRLICVDNLQELKASCTSSLRPHTLAA